MIGTIVFLATFLLFVIITLIVPSVPPGQIICNAFGKSETNYSLTEVSGELVVASVINGLIWGVIILMVHSYLRGPSKGQINLPVWLPRYTSSYNSKRENKSPKKHDASFKENIKSQDLESIKGISYINVFRLKQIGINTIDDFLSVASSKVGRNNLARFIGVRPSTILRWIKQAEASKAPKRS